MTDNVIYASITPSEIAVFDQKPRSFKEKTMSRRRINVVSGPSKRDLSLALFESKEIEFELEGMGKCKIRLQSILREQGGIPDTFLIGGLISLGEDTVTLLVNLPHSGSILIYNPRLQDGSLQLEER